MRGFPKHFNTRADVDYCLREYPAEMKMELQDWIDNRTCWEAKPLDSKDAGITDETHQVEVKDGIKTQLTKIDDPVSKLIRLGISVANAEKMVQATAEQPVPEIIDNP